MTLFERISYLAKKQGLSVFDLAEKLNLSRNSIYSWKKSSPKAETLEKVAEYFDVTTDYLLGRTENPNSDSLEEDEITTFFRVNTEDLTES
ncbi:helix-turn-helix domain-containing protein, partial [Enterococcus faecalis]